MRPLEAQSDWWTTMVPSGKAYRYIEACDDLPLPEKVYRLPLDQQIARVKLFGGPATWWIAAYDPDTRIAYGVAEIQEREAGDFSMEEIVQLRIPPFALPVERDLYWTPVTLAEVLSEGRS